MRLVIRVAIGLALAAGGLTFLTYGIAQAIENGSCGTSSNGISYGAACPAGFGPMIALMVFGTFFALAGAALAGVIGRFVAVIFIAVIAGVVLGFVDLDAETTQPGPEVMLAVLVPMAVFVLPGVGRRRRTAFATVTETLTGQPPQPQPAAPGASFGTPPQWQPRSEPTPPRPPASPQHAEDIASRLRQLEQLKDSGLLDENEYSARRKQILAEL